MLSRVADSLYWMSRYLERAEYGARLIDLNLVLMLDQSPAFATQRWQRLQTSLGSALDADPHDAFAITAALTFDRSERGSIMACLSTARDNARQVREQLSSEMWEQLNRLYLQVSHTASDEFWHSEPHTFFRGVKEGAHLFHGIADATMPQGEGWHFMQLGRFMERAGATAALLDAHFGTTGSATEGEATVSDYLDWVGLLKSCTAFEAYCQVYTADLQPVRIAEFLLLNPDFPHTVRFAVSMVETALRSIGRLAGGHNHAQVERLAGRLRATLDYAHIDEIMAGDMHAFLGDIQRQCSQLHQTINQSYFAPPLEAIISY